MNKEEILEKLNKLDLDKDRFIVATGASLVMQDFIDETSDIDLSCDESYYNMINWNKKIGAFGIEIKNNSCFEIGSNIYCPNDVILVNGYKCMNLKKCYEIKKQLNRNRDKDIIKKLENFLQIN